MLRDSELLSRVSADDKFLDYTPLHVYGYAVNQALTKIDEPGH